MNQADCILVELIQIFENNAVSKRNISDVKTNDIAQDKKELVEQKMVPVDSQIYDDLTDCCNSSIFIFSQFWTENKSILMAGGSHFLCIVFKNGDLNATKYIIENGGAIYLNRKSHLDCYPFDEICDWNELKNLKKKAKDKIKYLIKMGSSMCWDALWAMFWYEKDMLDLYVETLQNINDLRDDPMIKERFANIAMERAKTNEQMEVLISKGIKPGYMDLVNAFMKNDNERASFFIKHMNINETNDKGNTVLHELCKNSGWIDSKDGVRIVSFCLKNGADPTIKNDAGDSALSLVESFCKQNENEMLKRILHEMKLIVDNNYAPAVDDEMFIQRWKCIYCNYGNNLITNIVCKQCETERIVDLLLFSELINIQEIGSVLYALIDCIALNSLIELDLLTLNQYDALFSKEIRKNRYLKEMQDRLTKTLSDGTPNVLDVKKVKVVCLSKDVNLNIDDILKEVMSDSDLRNIISEWKNEIGYSQKTELQICKEKLLNKHSSNDFAEIYPLNKSFSLQDEQCMKFIAMCIAFKHSKFYFGYTFTRHFENTKWNYSDILSSYCKLLIKQDLLNEYKKNEYFAPMNMVNMKHEFEHFYFNEKISERDSLCVHARRVQNILNYCNEYKHKMNAQNANECLSEMRFGELLFNMDTEYNEQYEIDGNMLKDISQKILLERFVGDIINEWYCLDLKKMQSDGDDYENTIFSNYFYGVLSQKVHTDTVYEIEFVESVVSYYHTYRS
eukprot:332185_1